MRRRTFQHVCAAAILAAIICLAFGDIVFHGRTLLASSFQAGTMPTGPYGYTGRQVGCRFHGSWVCGFWPIIDSVAPALQFEPYVKLLHNDMAHHWLPLWNPYVGAGAPLMANMAPAALSPVRLILASADSPAFWDFYLLLRLLVAAFFTYLFARELGIGFAGSLVAGIAFGLSGHFIYYINMADLDAQIWLPALLLVTKKVAEKPAYRMFAVTVALAALVILAGMPESAFFIFLLATLYFFFCLSQLAPEHRHEPRWWRKPLAAYAGAGAAGLLISLPQVLPFLEFLPNALNPRAPGVGMNYTSAGTLPSLIMRSFFGHLYDEWNGADVFSILPYVGCVCSLLALGGICRKRRQNPVSLFFAGCALFYLLKAFGIPPVQWVGRLPLFNMSLFPKHAFPEFALSMAMLAGIGAHQVLQSELDYSRFLFASVLLALTVMGFVAYYWNEASSAGHMQDITENLLLFDIAFTLVWLTATVARRFPRSAIVAIALVTLPAAELVGSVPRSRADRYESFRKPPFVDFLRRDSQPYRTFSVDDVLFPNTNAAYGIEDVRTLDPLQVHRYADFLRANFSPFIYDRFDSSEVTRQILRSPMLDLMNVKYILGDPQLPVSAISNRFELVYDGEIRIYRNTKVLPRAFIATHAEIIRDRNSILARLADPDFDPRQKVILEEEFADQPPAPVTANSPVIFDRYEPNYIRLHAQVNQPGWLVLTDTYYPGWKVLIDGKAGRILPADYIFRGVALQPGAHVVEFVYRPASFLWGVAISALTVALLVFLPFWLRRQRAERQDEEEHQTAEPSVEHELESVGPVSK